MTTFRLNAGRPTTYPSRRPSARKEEKEEQLARMSYWCPRMEPDTPLACGCLIPWPVIQAFGQHIHGQIWCSEHGWQPKITKQELQRVRKVAKQCASDSTPILIPPTSEDSCPF